MRGIAVTLLLVLSVGIGVVRSWGALGRQHHEYDALSSYEIAHMGAIQDEITRGPFDAFRAAIEPGSRYYLDTREGSDHYPLQWAVYWLLPSVPVSSPREADVILAYDENVHALGLRFAKISRPAPHVTVAWPAR